MPEAPRSSGQPEPQPDERLTAHPGFAAGQIQRAITALALHDASARTGKRAAGWWDVLTGMLTGSIRVGSRSPLAETPSWATPQVYTGGFATGRLMAGGPLTSHERRLLIAIGQSEFADRAVQSAEAAFDAAEAVRTASTASSNDWLALRRAMQAASEAATAAEAQAGPARAALHAHYLSDRGLPDLLSMLGTGRYRAATPEETALLCVGWLAANGYDADAQRVLDEITPYFDRLRFYPAPAAMPRRTTGYCIATLGEVRARWQRLRVPPSVKRQREVLSSCVPLHDRLVALWSETVEGEPPRVDVNDDTRPIVGGWPCQRYPGDWATRAKHLAIEIREADCASLGSRWRDGRRGTFPWLAEPLALASQDPKRLTGQQVGRIRTALAQIATSRGLPGSAGSEAVRSGQRRTLATPLIAALTAALDRRTSEDPADEGLLPERLATLSAPITAEEDPNLAGRPLPKTILRKLSAAREGSLDDLVDAKLVPSAETLVTVLPRVVARGRSAGWSDPALRILTSEAYEAFARRRSLLLLNLESQVGRMEVPWIKAIERHRDRADGARASAKNLLTELVCLVLRRFPYTILPNRFVRQARTLVRDAGLDIPLTEELAADIFMGTFTGHFLAAAKDASALLNGSLYERYFGLRYRDIAVMQAQGKPDGPKTCQAFDLLCAELALEANDRKISGRSPAANGAVIEQQQVITTHNLATLFWNLDLDRKLAADLLPMAKACFTWILDRLDAMPPGWVQRLRATKNAAYAWRQMIFFLSRSGEGGPHHFMEWAYGELARRRMQLREAFGPAIRGLSMAVAGDVPPPRPDREARGVRLLGWTTERHWLLAALDLPDPPKRG